MPIYINESGLYSLIISSHLEKAKQFKRWVTSEVLPSIRKTGSYTMPQPQMNLIEETAKELNATAEISEILVNKFHLTAEHAKILAFDMNNGQYKALTDEGIKQVKAALPPVQDNNVAKMTPSDIGKSVAIKLQRPKDITAVKINKALEKLGYQKQIVVGVNKNGTNKNEWELTQAGEQYANKFAYSNNGHSGFQIKWKNDIVDIIVQNSTNLNI